MLNNISAGYFQAHIITYYCNLAKLSKKFQSLSLWQLLTKTFTSSSPILYKCVHTLVLRRLFLVPYPTHHITRWPKKRKCVTPIWKVISASRLPCGNTMWKSTDANGTCCILYPIILFENKVWFLFRPCQKSRRGGNCLFDQTDEQDNATGSKPEVYLPSRSLAL